ncbi:Gx transporter family protein [Thermodesulfobacteriota bacterium]
MPSAADSDMSRKIIFKATLLLFAITVNALEMFLPRLPFLPWLKPGFANCVTIVWIIRYGGVEALFFTLLRIWLVCFYFGLSFITLSLSLSGGVFATCVMGTAWHILGRQGLIGTIGLAILGAIAHNFGQLLTVFFLLTYNVYIFYQIPFMIIASVIFGSLVGILAPMLSRLASQTFENLGEGAILMPENQRVSRSCLFISVVMLMLSISLVFIDNFLILLVLAVLTSSSVQIILGGSMQALLFPIKRFWLLFLFVACLLMFLPYGKKIEWAPWFTYEGIQATLKQWLRLWTWLQISFIFTYFKFHGVIFRALNFFFKSHKSTLYAGLLAVEDFPGVFDLIRKRITMEFRPMLRHPIVTTRNVFKKVFHDVSDYIISRHRDALKKEQV